MKEIKWAVLGCGVIANEMAVALQKNGKNIYCQNFTIKGQWVYTHHTAEHCRNLLTSCKSVRRKRICVGLSVMITADNTDTCSL